MRLNSIPVIHWIGPLLPFCLLLLVFGLSPGPADGGGRGILAAGFRHVKVAGRGGSYRGVDSSRAANREDRRLSIRVPSLERAQSAERAESVITVAKSNLHYDVDFNAGRGRWKYLSKAVREQIDAARVEPDRWRYVVVHNSATDRGNARVFDYYHRRVKKMEDGLAYHFVIGNGSYSGNGEVEVGSRWIDQLDGGHLHNESLNGQAIGICLVGDFNREKVEEAQLEALDELVDYLQAKVGMVTLTTHEGMDVNPTPCPGRFFPQDLLR